MKISSDTYMLMQAHLLSVVHAEIKEPVNPSYVKSHIDSLLKENDCVVIQLPDEMYLSARSVSVTVTNHLNQDFKL